MSKLPVPSCCPLKDFLEKCGHKLKDFDCSKCLVNPDYCRIFCGDLASKILAPRHVELRKLVDDLIIVGDVFG